jgi:hypothetical protein
MNNQPSEAALDSARRIAERARNSASGLLSDMAIMLVAKDIDGMVAIQVKEALEEAACVADDMADYENRKNAYYTARVARTIAACIRRL